MDAELKAEWVAALRSGRYQQAREILKGSHGYCCIGVLGDLQGLPWQKMSDAELESSTLPLRYQQPPVDTALKLARMNDDGKSFSEIADYIEQNL